MFDLHLLASAAQDQQQALATIAPQAIGTTVGYVVVVVGLWPLLAKADRPGWGALIPVYNVYLLVKIAGLHGALTILYFIPLVNIIFGIFVALGVGRAFDRGPIFSLILLWIFPVIGYYIVGYGSSRYQGDGGEGAVA